MSKPTRQPVLDIYTCLQNRHRDEIARRLGASDRAFVRAQMYMRTPRTREVSKCSAIGYFLFAFGVSGLAGLCTYFLLRFLTSLPK